MTTMPVETYGLGGYDPEKPNGNLVDTTSVPIPVTEQNRNSLTAKAVTALQGNATYLGIATPTAAQTTAQVKALTRQMSALIRLTLNQLDDTAGT